MHGSIWPLPVWMPPDAPRGSVPSVGRLQNATPPPVPGSAGSAGTTTQGGGTGNSVGSSGGDNQGDNLFDGADIWSDPAENEEGKQKKQERKPDVNKMLSDIANGYDLQIDANSLYEAAQGQDPEAFKTALEGNLRNFLRSTLSLTFEMIRESSRNMQQQMKGEAQTAVMTHSVRNLMEKEIPLAKKANAKPMVEAVVQRFLSQGNTPETAVSKAKKFLSEMAREASPDTGEEHRSGNGSTRSPAKTIDWGAFARGE